MLMNSDSSNLWSNQVSAWWERKGCCSWIKDAHTPSVPLRVCTSLCFLTHKYALSQSSVFVLSPTAYQLRTCQPPPPVANASILTDDDEFEIGLSHFISLVYHPKTLYNEITFPYTWVYLFRQPWTCWKYAHQMLLFINWFAYFVVLVVLFFFNWFS